MSSHDLARHRVYLAEFTAADVGTVDSGLNSLVLASNAENVLLPINEPTYGTRRRSQIETYLVANGGEGVQHIALFTDDVFRTVRTLHGLTRPYTALHGLAPPLLTRRVSTAAATVITFRNDHVDGNHLHTWTVPPYVTSKM